MSRTSLRLPVTALAGILVLTVGCFNTDDPDKVVTKPRAKRLGGGGSSFVNPMMEKWRDVYLAEKGITLKYQSVGSGAGIEYMTDRTFDFGCTDAFMKDKDIEKAKGIGGEVIHIPLVMGAVVAAYNLTDVERPLKFTGPVLADIFLGVIKKWNHPTLRELNPDVTLPDLDIQVVHRSDKSGTTAIWTDYLTKVSPSWRSLVKPESSGTAINWPYGIGQENNEGLSDYISKTPGSIGYTELAFAEKKKLQHGFVRNREDKDIRGSLVSVTAAAAASMTEIPADLRFSLTNAPGADSYPISGVVWAVLYVNQKADKGQMIVDFLQWATHDGQQYAKSLNFSSLPDGLRTRIEEKLKEVKAGK